MKEKNILSTILNRNFEGLLNYLFKKVTSNNDKLYLSNVMKLYKTGRLDEKQKEDLYNKIKKYFEKTNDVEGLYLNHPDKTFFENYIKENNIKLNADNDIDDVKNEIKEVINEQKSVLENVKNEIKELKTVNQKTSGLNIENINTNKTNTKEILTYSALGFLFGLTISLLIKK